jgi:hypothetical protein
MRGSLQRLFAVAVGGIGSLFIDLILFLGALINPVAAASVLTIRVVFAVDIVFVDRFALRSMEFLGIPQD